MEYTPIAPLPRQLVLETVSVCNLRCPSCHLGDGKIDRSKKGNTAFMSVPLFDKICNEVRDSVKYTYLHLWGEPTLHKDLDYFIRKTKEFSAVQMTTHGMFIDEKMADSISLCDDIAVSIDGLDQETYEKYRVRGDFDRAMNGLKLLAKRCPKKVIWTFIVFSHNEHQIDLAQKIANDLGIQIGFKPAYFINDNVKKEMLPKNKDYWRITVNSDGDAAHIMKRKACREFWETIYVIPNGDVVTCCYDFNAQMVMGNANNNTIPEIWNGQGYLDLRKEHLLGNLSNLCAKHCYLPK